MEGFQIKLLAPVLACLVLISMSPAALEAFSQITGAEILSGTMDLSDAMSGMIYAVGRKNGQTWEIEATWSNGYPKEIKFLRPQGES